MSHSFLLIIVSQIFAGLVIFVFGFLAGFGIKSYHRLLLPTLAISQTSVPVFFEFSYRIPAFSDFFRKRSQFTSLPASQNDSRECSKANL